MASRVLVTGATGFIGTNLVRALRDRGVEVHGLACDRPERLPADVPLTLGRVEDPAAVRAALDHPDLGTVFHLAAQTLVGVARNDPAATFESNVRGTWTLLEACRRRGGQVRRIVIASSDKAYGASPDLPYTEASPLDGRFPYDVSKTCADLLAQSYAVTYDLPVAIARCGNVFGPGDLNFSRLVPGVLRDLLRGERPRLRSDGTPVRDYLYIDDAIRGYLALASWLDDEERAASEPAFNLGPADPLSVMEMTHHLRVAVGREDLVPIVEDAASHEIPRQHLDSTRARRVLGWAPQVALDDALARTVRWYQSALLVPEPAV